VSFYSGIYQESSRSLVAFDQEVIEVQVYMRMEAALAAAVIE
jgi:hypothetical protein